MQELTVLSIQFQDYFNETRFLQLNNIVSFEILHSKVSNFSVLNNLNNLSKLQYLNITNTSINTLDFLLKVKMFNLHIFDFSSTEIHNLKKYTFQNSPNMHTIRFEKCRFFSIEEDAFKYLNNVRELFMKDTNFEAKYAKRFINYLIHTQYIESEIFQLCCLFWKTFSSKISCTPKPTGFLTCQNIIPSLFLKSTFWTFGLIGVIGNSFSIIILICTKSASYFYRISLSLGDFLTSMYILSIAIADIYFSNEKYLENEENWRKGKLCSFLGTTITFGLLLALNALLLISIERYESVIRPLAIPKMKIYRKQLFTCMIICCLTIAIFPLIFYTVSMFFFFFFSVKYFFINSEILFKVNNLF